MPIQKPETVTKIILKIRKRNLQQLMEVCQCPYLENKLFLPKGSKMSFEASYVKSNKTELAAITAMLVYGFGTLFHMPPCQPPASQLLYYCLALESLLPDRVSSTSTFNKKGTEDVHLQLQQSNSEEDGYTSGNFTIAPGAKRCHGSRRVRETVASEWVLKPASWVTCPVHSRKRSHGVAF